MHLFGRFARLVVVLPSIAGCVHAPPAERTIQTSNPGYSVEQSFTDPTGNTVYKFVDSGEPRYYVVGPHGPQMATPTSKPKRDQSVAPDDISNDILRAGAPHQGHR
jgi:hypothetical protein